MKIPSPKPSMLCWLEPKFLTEFLMRTLLTLDAGSRWLPLTSGSVPIHQRGKESIWFHLSLLWSGTSCLLSLTKIVQYLNTSRTHIARAAGLYFSSPDLLCLSSHASVSVSSMLLWLPATTAMHHYFGERASKPTVVKPYVDTTCELNQRLSLMLELKSFRLKSVFSRTGKILSHI